MSEDILRGLLTGAVEAETDKAVAAAYKKGIIDGRLAAAADIEADDGFDYKYEQYYAARIARKGGAESNGHRSN